MFEDAAANSVTTSDAPVVLGNRCNFSECYFQILKRYFPWLRSVQFSWSVMSYSLWPHESQHARPPCPSPTPRACPNSCPLSRWCHPTSSSSVVPFSSFPQSFPASGFFQMNQFFTSGGHSTGVSASASVLPMNIQDWFPLVLTGLISLQSKALSRVFSNITVQKHQFFGVCVYIYIYASSSHIGLGCVAAEILPSFLPSIVFFSQ